MAFGLPQRNSENIEAGVKYDANAGRWFRMDRTQVGGQWQSDDVEISDRFVAVFDFANVRCGWITFLPKPDFLLVPLNTPVPPRPTDDYRFGVQVRVLLSEKAADGMDRIRVLSALSNTLLDVLDALHDEYNANPFSKQGKLPVIAHKGVLSKQTPRGKTIYVPKLEIVKWVPRPEDFDETSVQKVHTTPDRSPPAPETGSTRVDPPRKPVAPPVADDDDFG